MSGPRVGTFARALGQLLPFKTYQRQPSFPFHAPFLSPFHTSHVSFKWRGSKNHPPVNFSPAQKKIAEICRRHNVVVSARPGSGKTATTEAIAAANADKLLLVMTYSRRLRDETAKRLKRYDNCRVGTFHEMFGHLVNDVISDDVILLQHRNRVLSSGQLPVWQHAPFDIIILDEFQDCTDSIHWLTNCLILANGEAAGGQSPRVVVLGDERQSIYRFRGADSRYLTLASEILGPVVPYSWESISLDQSFRLSHQATQFINDVFLDGDPYVIGSKQGPKPILVRCNPFNVFPLANVLSRLIKVHGGAGNSAILAPSLRSARGPVCQLVNTLAEKYGVPIAVSINDEIPQDKRVAKGKMLVTTIHQFKGSERDVVIVFGLDSSYFEFFGRDLPDDRCPNEVFVAVTRATKQLVLIHNDSKSLMPFVSTEALSETAEIVNLTNKTTDIKSSPASRQSPDPVSSLPSETGVQDMIRHIRGEFLNEMVNRHLHVACISSPMPEDECIKIPNIVASDAKGKFYEDVSDLNGMVVAAACEHDLVRTLKMLGLSKALSDGEVPPIASQEHSIWLSKCACEYEALVSGYRPRSIQLKDHPFDWVDPPQLTKARKRLREQLGDVARELDFEVNAGGTFSVGEKGITIMGQADIVAGFNAPDGNDDESDQSVWEIKFVYQLSDAHIAQVCVYAYFLSLKSGKVPRIVLFNVRDGEKREITPRNGQESLRQLIESILLEKNKCEKDMTDEDFLKMCAETTGEVLRLAH